MSDVLKKFNDLSGKVFVGDSYRSSTSSNRFDVIDPATEEKIGEIADITKTEIDEAVERATSAQKKWARMAALERAHILHQVADKMTAQRALFAEALTREMGKQLSSLEQ